MAWLLKNLSKMRIGPFLGGYLKPQAMCSTCSKNFSFMSADDGPAWLTLVIVGHAIVPLMLVFGRSDFVTQWLTDATGQNEFSDKQDLQD